ncbi:hypothetical protein [Anaerotardibacter muris]|uniref:hypothetical protein n=1 Tax=Anaerotardibacter muris TaxID=2941505 RepID=UPI00204036CD|nr:hypothetical protein [Anaerotardibacter muris]
MADQQKKYSLIDLDTGTTEEEIGVRTTRSVIDGEETIVVQSAPVSDAADVPASNAAQKGASVGSSSDPAQLVAQAEAPIETQFEEDDIAVSAVAWSKPQPKAKTQSSAEPSNAEDDEVPFRRMQAVIIACLIAVIVVFVIYFNFLR